MAGHCCSTDSLRSQLAMPRLRSIFRHHLSAVLVGILLLVATFSATLSSSADPVESAQPTIDDALIYEIVTNARSVLLITQLTNNNHILVIISSTQHCTDLALNDAHVFEQPLDNLGQGCIYLKPSTPFLTRWPTVTGWYRGMFAVPDSTGDNIVMESDQRKAYALHLSTGTLEALPKLNGNSAIWALEWTWSFSSTEAVHYFLVDNKQPTRWAAQHFNSDTLDQATDIPYVKSYYICDSGQSSSGQRIRVSSVECQVPIKWNITAGYINATTVVLVDKTNSVLIFESSVLTSGQSTKVVKIPAEKFWVKWVSPLEPSNQTRASSTEKSAGTESTKPTTAKWPVVLVLTIAVPNLLLVLCLIALSIYCLCKPSDKSALAKPPKVIGGPHNQQDSKSTAQTARKGGTKEKLGSSAINFKTKAARSSTAVKKVTTSSSSHLPGKSATASKASKVGKTSVSKSATAVSKASKNANASTSKRSLAGPNAPSSKAARVH